MKITDDKIIEALKSEKWIWRSSYADFKVRAIDGTALYSGFRNCNLKSNHTDEDGLCLGDLLADDWEVMK